MPPAFNDLASDQNDFDICAFFRSIWGWILGTLYAINDESESFKSDTISVLKYITTALEHPYYVVLALLVVCAWPHILALPIWFGKDAYRRMERQTRQAVSHVVKEPPKRKRMYTIALPIEWLVSKLSHRRCLYFALSRNHWLYG